MSRFICLHDRAGDAVAVSVTNIIAIEATESGSSAIFLHGLAVPLQVTEEVVEIFNRLDGIRGD